MALALSSASAAYVGSAPRVSQGAAVRMEVRSPPLLLSLLTSCSSLRSTQLSRS